MALIVLRGGSLFGVLSMAAAQGWQEIGPAVKRNGIWEVTVR